MLKILTKTAQCRRQKRTIQRVALKKLLAPAPISVDELIDQCQMSLAVVSTVLLELELAGRWNTFAAIRFLRMVNFEIQIRQLL